MIWILVLYWGNGMVWAGDFSSVAECRLAGQQWKAPQAEYRGYECLPGKR